MKALPRSVSAANLQLPVAILLAVLSFVYYLYSYQQHRNAQDQFPPVPAASENELLRLSQTSSAQFKSVSERESDYVLYFQEGEYSLPKTGSGIPQIILRNCSIELTDGCPDFEVYINSEEFTQGRELGVFSLVFPSSLTAGDTVTVVKTEELAILEEYRLEQQSAKVLLLVSRQ